MARNLVSVSVLLCLFITIAHSAPPNPPAQVARFAVVREDYHQDPNLEYSFSQEFANGEKFSQDGKLKTVNGMDVIVNQGSYTIVNPDGSETIVNYTADEDGFHPIIIEPTSH